MSKVKDGDTVKVHYTGKLEDGTAFDSSKEGEPLELTIGAGNVIEGFEKGVIGMERGGSKTVTIPPEEAYRSVNEELVAKVKKETFPGNITPVIGEQLQLKQQDGNVVNVTITEIRGDTVTLDANHHLSGKTLIFDIELVEIK
jgi:FKBP-type peptidyl-prolyl cis-trans isomerase 2